MKKTTLAILIASAMAAPVMAAETTEALEVTADTVVVDSSGFWSDATISGNVATWTRQRTRDGEGRDESAGSGNDDNNTIDERETKTNLDQTSVYAAIDFTSGFAADKVGIDVSAYATADLYNQGSPDHEMNFWDVDNPYTGGGEDGAWDSTNTSDGIAVSKANIKFQKILGLNGKVGLFQPSVPSALGVNWSYAPGTYTGGEIGTRIAGIELGAVFATEYRAPWFKSSYGFRETDNLTDAGELYSVGARTELGSIAVDVAYAGLTDGPRKIAHIKTGTTLENGLGLKGQVYMVDDSGMYEELAYHAAFLSNYSTGQYTVKAEATYTSAVDKNKDNVGNFSYRATAAYGSSNGAYDIWWNNRSDFNHDGEVAVFASLARDMADLGAENLTVGISGAYGFGAQGEGVEELTEAAVSVFGSYNAGFATFGAHVTQYNNGTNLENWTVYTNAFQDETDIKITMNIPFSIK
ncbi:multidrug transporter [Moritella sp. 24]|uniref:hypothetical protein n=1 Tax=Moritella sp. 24 TaxID=2746230 RepID=UPI001BA741EE|nr:hypothetical protein [Moritella sp. 24]QUM77237.1 multidrug transporter [Moritella sp. 24]